MNDQALFNWGFWDGYHCEDEPQKPENSAYMAGFECAKQQRQLAQMDTAAQQAAYKAYLQNKS